MAELASQTIGVRNGRQRCELVRKEERPRAAHKCSPTVSCPGAIAESGRGVEIGCPACGRTRPVPPALPSPAPTRDLYPDSIDSIRPGCAYRGLPTLSRGDRRAHSLDTER